MSGFPSRPLSSQSDKKAFAPVHSAIFTSSSVSGLTAWGRKNVTEPIMIILEVINVNARHGTLKSLACRKGSSIRYCDAAASANVSTRMISLYGQENGSSWYRAIMMRGECQRQIAYDQSPMRNDGARDAHQ